jgi:DNA-binding NtrC family response regulator
MRDVFRLKDGKIQSFDWRANSSSSTQVLDYFGKTLEQLKGWRTGDVLHPDDLASAIADWRGSIEQHGLAQSGTLAAQEKAIIEEALRASGGRVYGPSGAAERLGVPRSTLESKIRAFRINKSRFRVRPARTS